MIKTAVIGASGYVGRSLWNAYRREFPDCVGTSFSNPASGLIAFDIRSPDIIPLRLEATGHRAVLISAAKPNVAYCENEPQASYAVNVKGMLDLIEQIGRTSLQVIFLSSDYVFDGRSGNYGDDHPTGPTTEYGRQKAIVEKEISNLTDNFLILRLSKMFGITPGDGTLLDELAQNLRAGKEVQVARDQFFCPTRVDELTAAIEGIQSKGLRGVMNVAAPERWSRYEIAKKLAEAISCNLALVKPILLYDIPSMQGRPLDTSMVSTRLQETVKIQFSPFMTSVHQFAENWRRS